MKQKTTLRRIELLEVYDSTAIARKVETMAACGWLAERVGRYFWYYRRCEPQTLHAAVQYFPKASDFDPAPSEAEREMMDYAARDGWQPLFRWGQAQVFINTAAEPTPLQTDAVAQTATLRKALLRSQLPVTLVLLVLYSLMTAMQTDMYRRHPLEFLSNGLQLSATGLMVLLLVLLVSMLVRLALWMYRAPAAAQAGVFLPLPSARRFNIVMLLLAALLFAFGVAWSGQALPILLAWTVLYLLVLRVSFALKDHLKAAGAPRDVNRFATAALAVGLALAATVGLVWFFLRIPLQNAGHVTGTYTYPSGYTRDIYDDPLPLSLQDLVAVPDSEVRSREQERDATPLLAVTDCRDWGFTEPHSGPLAYTLYEPRWAWLYDFCEQQLLAEHSTPDPGPDELADYWFAVDPAPWGAGAVYQQFFSDGTIPSYLICWPGRLALLDLPWEPTAQQVAIIAGKLNVR